MLGVAARRMRRRTPSHPFSTRRYLEQVAHAHTHQRYQPWRWAKDGILRSPEAAFVATGATNEAVAKAFEWVRQRIGFYGSTRAYWPVFAAHGLENLGEKLNHMAKHGQWSEMTARGWMMTLCTCSPPLGATTA